MFHRGRFAQACEFIIISPRNTPLAIQCLSVFAGAKDGIFGFALMRRQPENAAFGDRCDRVKVMVATRLIRYPPIRSSALNHQAVGRFLMILRYNLNPT